jgi:uncharacterized membrane protein (UPF0127 family)
VVFRPKGRAEISVAVEIARTPGEIRRGLMHRTSLPPDAGMLFLFPRASALYFWMKDTIVPLDMIFVGADLVVAGVVANAEPGSLAPRGIPGVTSQYVVEVNAGWARVHHVGAGVPVELVGVAPASVRDR